MESTMAQLSLANISSKLSRIEILKPVLMKFVGEGRPPVEAAKAKLDAAVTRLERSYSAWAAPQGKSFSIPKVTLQDVASSYEFTAKANDLSQRGDCFGKAIENLMLASIHEEPQLNVEPRKKTQAAKETFNKGVIKIGDFIGKLLPLAIFACGVTSTVGDASLVALPLKAVANGATLVLQLCQREKDRGEELTSELDRISYQSRRIHEIQKHSQDFVNSLLQEKSLELMAEIINFLTASMQYLKHGFFMKVAKSIALGPEIWQASIKSLHLAYEEYDQALLLQIASSMIDQQTQAREASVEGKDDAFFQWLSPSVWEVEAQLLANRSQRADGTLGWVLELEEFRKWRVGNLENAGSTPAQTLWLNGLPGTGKSTISAYLYDLLIQQYPDATILHFFCKSGTPGLTNAYDIVRTLCYQLTQKDKFYQRLLMHKPDLPGTGRYENVVLLFNTLLKGPLAKGNQDSDIFVVLDGLDELEDTSSHSGQASYANKTEIEALLEALVQIPRAKILVTSRSSPELKRVLGYAGFTRTISWRDNSEDIQRYVRSRLNRSSHLLSRFQQLGKDPVEFFTKANGIFLWAALILDILERTVSTNAFSVALEQVPPTMNSIYDQIIERAISSGNYKWIKEILGWTLVLPSPFAVQQMNTAVDLSLNDELYNMEDFLRSECGSLLSLVPVLGSSQDFEVHIGHETFQAYLTDPATSHEGLFSPNIGHGKATLACLRYLINEKPLTDKKFKLHAITKWRWHLRASMGIPERAFAEPLSALDGGKSLPAELSQEIIVALYKLLTTTKVDQWLEHYFLDKRIWDKLVFSEVYHTCIEVSAWYRVNKEHLDVATFETYGISAESLISWCEGLSDLQCIANWLWTRACHVWLWNNWRARWPIICGYEALVQLDIWTNHPAIMVSSDEADRLLKDEARVVEANEKNPRSKSSGRLFGNLTLRYANYYSILQNGVGAREHLDAVMAAGSFDEMSGVCLGNVSVALSFIASRTGFDESKREEALAEAMMGIQDALIEDPDGNPRHYEHLGHLYDGAGKKDSALEAWKAGLALDFERETCCGEEYFQQKVWAITKKDTGCTTQDCDIAIAILEEAIEKDPGNASSRWFHQMADLYKQKGDLEGARRTYKANMKFDPSWNSQWEEIADTFIGKEIFDETRQFDWRAYCDTLTEAVIFDPSQAHSYWSCWVRKAEDLKEYQHFDLAVEILEYGIESSSSMKNKAAIEARARFEYVLGTTFCAMLKWDAAISSFEDSFRHMLQAPARWEYKSLGDAYTSCSRYEDALALFNKILQDDPDSSSDHAALAETHLLSGAPAKALKNYKIAIRLQEKWAAKRAGSSSYYSTAFDKYVRDWYIDLGMAHERLSRRDQAVACFQRALPHAEDQVTKMLVRHDGEIAFEDDFLHRSTGRALVKLGWLYERLDPSDIRAADAYEKAVWVFKTTVHAEDDFLEETEGLEAEETLARVKRGELWTYPGDDADRDLRERVRAMTYRMNYGVNLERRKRGTKKSMMRGH